MTELQEAQFIRVIDRLVNDNKSLRDLVDFQTKENERLRETLLYYADFRNWHIRYGGTYILVDGGIKARAALEGKE